MRAPRSPRWAAGGLLPVALLVLTATLPTTPPATPPAASPRQARDPATTHSTARARELSGSGPAAPIGAPAAFPSAGVPTWPVASTCTSPADPGAGAGTDRAVHAPPGDRFSPITALGPQLRLRRAYAIRAGRLAPVDGVAQVRPCDADLWQVVLTVTPARVRPHIAELVVFDGPDHSPAGRLLGDVEPAGDDPGAWRLALRLDGGDSHELLFTIAHEVAHLVSLAADQMDRGHTGRDCPTYLTATGCLRADSLLLGFLDDTWSTGLFREWARADEQPTEAARLTALAAFHARHRRDFVTASAATAPEEDFAESWASWCVDGPGATAEGRARSDWVGRTFAPQHDVAAGCAVLRALAPHR